jgi:DNA polymerase-3 subunit delta
VSWRPKKKLKGLTFEQLKRQLAQGIVEPLYLFAGEEIYLQRRAIALLASTLDESLRVLNVASYSLAAESGVTRSRAAALIDSARQLPMMAARRIIVARDVDKLIEGDTELILAYLQRPSPTTTLIFQAQSLDRRKKLTEMLLDRCAVVAFDPLSDHELARWADGFVATFGCTLQPAALDLLVSLTGTGLMRLANELEKLAIYTGEGQITEESVALLVRRAREHSGLELWEATVKRDGPGTMRLVRRLLDDGDEPLALVGSLASLHRKMLTAKEMYARGSPVAEVAKATAQFGERAGALRQRVSRMSREEIVRRMGRIAEVDNAIKRSEATPRLQIEYLVAELAR